METNLNKLKEQAEINAFKKLQYDFNTPEQLEQIEQHMNRNEKKKVHFSFWLLNKIIMLLNIK
jgi:hypothetical protein